MARLVGWEGRDKVRGERSSDGRHVHEPRSSLEHRRKTNGEVTRD